MTEIPCRLPTLADLLLPRDQHLEIWCCRYDCRHEARWTAQEALERLGAAATIPQAASRLRCAACGARGRAKEVRCRPCVLDYSAWCWAERQARDRAEYGPRPREAGPAAS